MDGFYPHDSYSWYDLELSREAEAREHGFDNWEDYQMSKSDENPKAYISMLDDFNIIAKKIKIGLATGKMIVKNVLK